MRTPMVMYRSCAMFESADSMWWLAAQAAALWYKFVTAVLQAVAFVFLRAPALLLQVISEDEIGKCRYYEGEVVHRRKKPVEHSFKYPIRTAVINLDSPPAWYRADQNDHLASHNARELAGTDGTVYLLTNPSSAGYSQNPISVYYCYDKAGALQQCIAEVTNTPWGGRVQFLFRPEGDAVPKCLHVSPLMDMRGTWHLRAPEPKDTLLLVVSVSHPDMGNYFFASMEARRSKVNARNDTAGWSIFLRYGLMPHRIAIWIYFEAVRLLLKGVTFFGPPDDSYKAAAEARAPKKMPFTDGRRYIWTPPLQWPWNAT